MTIESLGDALVVCEPDGTVASVNPRARELVPALEPGVQSQGPDSPLPDREDALRGEVVVDADDRILAVTAAEMEGEGVVWTIRDISERARLERMKTEFVATASHELRSPLTSIKGFVELLSRSDGLDEKQREFLDVILLSTNRLVDLVNDLLDVARIEAGQFEIHRRPTDARRGGARGGHADRAADQGQGAGARPRAAAGAAAGARGPRAATPDRHQPDHERPPVHAAARAASACGSRPRSTRSS